MQKRFPKRGFTELDLRRMMELATNFRRDYKDGRWIIGMRFRRKAWEVIVEPLFDVRKLEVITA